jgi:DNA mismatch repair protein MutS
VAVRETGGTVVFLHRLEPGGTDRSYGVHVAQLAGLPEAVLARARQVLHQLEAEHRVVPGNQPADDDPSQLALFGGGPPDPALGELRALDLDQLTPLQALNYLADLQRKAGGRT